MNDNQSAQQRPRPRWISWLTITLAILTIITFFAVYTPRTKYYYEVTQMGGQESVGVVGSPATQSMDKNSSIYYPNPYPYPDPNVPVTDTREFLKIYYGANMQTRDVQGLTRRVETTIKGYGGRIDQQSSSPKYSSISFVVSQNKYEAFRDELESLVGKKFLSINISSQNLLSQKLSIEEQEKQADKTLSDYKASRSKIVADHTNILKSLQSQIDAYVQRLANLRAQPQTAAIQAEIQMVSEEKSYTEMRLVSENIEYTNQLKNFDSNIKYAEDWQKAVEKQDQVFLDNVATVNGTVSIRWISLWGIVRLYLPGYWIPGILAALTVLSFLRDCRRFKTATSSK